MILFIDDELRSMGSFIEELRFSYDVTFKDNIDSGWEFLTKNYDKVELIIVDMMMPLGDQFKDRFKETNGGLRTGHYFYKKVREKYSFLPIILFTNFSVDDELEKIIDKDKKSMFLHKPDWLPHELVEKIQGFIS